jgi:radical SAM protein (TIGR01212 family)
MHPDNVPSNSRYSSYGHFLKEKFGCRVYKVSVDGGFSCPNRDGVLSIGGCAYCNNDSFRPKSAERLKSIPEQMHAGMEYLRRRYGAEKFIAYFQPFTNTYAPLETLIPLYESAFIHPDVIGLSLGTRPDCVDESKLAWLEEFARNHFVTVEYGLQSANDGTLKQINRGHTFQSWLNAMAQTRDRGIRTGVHLILGFPWETREEIVQTAGIISNQGVNFLKLHHLHIVQNTVFEREYREKPFPLLGMEEYADLVVDFLERLSPEVYIERLFGIAPEDQLIAPIWGKSKAEIQRYIESRFVTRDTWQGSQYSAAVVKK